MYVLEAHVEGDTWMAYDANSGGHATRICAPSLRGYTIVNPRAARPLDSRGKGVARVERHSHALSLLSRTLLSVIKNQH